MVKAYNLKGTGLTADDIQSIAIGYNINLIVNALKKIINTLPMEKIDVEEMLKIYERALEVAQAA